MRRIFLALLIVGGVVIPATHVGAVRSTAWFHLHASPSLLLDTRVGGWEMTSGVERSVSTIYSRAIVSLTVLGGSQETWVYLDPCGGAPGGPPQVAVAYAAAGEMQTNLIPIDTASSCITFWGDAYLVATVIGDEDGVGGSNYVAHPEPHELDVTPGPGTTIVPVRDASVAIGANLIAAWVTIGAPDDRVASWQAIDCDTQQGLTGQTITAPAGGFTDNLFILPISAAGNVCFQPLGGLTPDVAFVTRYGYLAPGATPTAEGLPYSGFELREMPGFVALDPDRLFDTREAGVPVAAGTEYHFTITDLPADATAVALNVTVTGTTAPGYVSVYPCEADRPEVSTVNFTGANQTVPNFALVSLGSDAELCFYAHATTHLLVDRSGYFAPGQGDGLLSLPRFRYDTRQYGTPVAAGASVTFPLLPTGNPMASAVVLNVTVTEPAADGFLTVYPCGTERPLASNVNYRRGQTRANLVTVRVPADGRVCFFSLAQAHIVVDRLAAYHADSNVGFLEEEPWRVFDTRDPAGSPPLDGDAIYSLAIDDPYIEAVAWNLTVTSPAGAGFASLFPCAPDVTNSSVNYAAGQTVANFAISNIDADGDICMYSLRTAHLIADEFGVFVTPLPWEVYLEGEP
jgi:hypothetical protein